MRAKRAERGRANEIPRSRFSLGAPRAFHRPFSFLSRGPSSSLSVSLSSFFFWLAPFISLRRQNTSTAAESISGRRGPPRRRCAGEYLSERKTNSVSTTLILPACSVSTRLLPSPTHPLARRGWKCGLFAEKSHSVGRAAAARITLFARGRAEYKGRRGIG